MTKQDTAKAAGTQASKPEAGADSSTPEAAPAKGDLIHLDGGQLGIVTSTHEAAKDDPAHAFVLVLGTPVRHDLPLALAEEL